MRDFIFALGFLQAHMVHGEWLDFEKRLKSEWEMMVVLQKDGLVWITVDFYVINVVGVASIKHYTVEIQDTMINSD